MLTQKTFNIITEVMYNAKDGFETVNVAPFTVMSDAMRCNATNVSGMDNVDMFNAYTSDTVAATRNYYNMVRRFFEAFDLETPASVWDIPTKSIRNTVPKKDVTPTMSGTYEQTRFNKKGTSRKVIVGKRFNNDGTQNANGLWSIPCSPTGQLKPFKTVGVVDVWHIIRPTLGAMLAEKLNADKRHVRVTLEYVGSMDIRG